MTKTTYGELTVRQVDKGFRCMLAPNAVHISDCYLNGSTPMAKIIFVAPNGIVTIRFLERTVVYRLEKQSFDDRTCGRRRGVKCYDDADIGVKAKTA